MTLQFEDNTPIDCGSLHFSWSTTQKGFADGCGSWVELYQTDEVAPSINEADIPSVTYTINNIIANNKYLPESKFATYPYMAMPTFSLVTLVEDEAKIEIGSNIIRS